MKIGEKILRILYFAVALTYFQTFLQFCLAGIVYSLFQANIILTQTNSKLLSRSHTTKTLEIISRARKFPLTFVLATTLDGILCGFMLYIMKTLILAIQS